MNCDKLFPQNIFERKNRPEHYQKIFKYFRKIFPRVIHELGQIVRLDKNIFGRHNSLKGCFQICGSYWLRTFLQYLPQIVVLNQIYHLPYIVYSTVPKSSWIIPDNIFLSSGTTFRPDFKNPVDFMRKKYWTGKGEKFLLLSEVVRLERRKNIRYVIRLDVSASVPTFDVELFPQEDGIGSSQRHA